MNDNVDRVLDDIKKRLNVYIDSLQTNLLVKNQLKKLVSNQVDKLPDVIEDKRARSLVSTLMDNRVVARNAELQRQLGAAYWTLKTAMKRTPAGRARVIDKLLAATCFQRTQGGAKNRAELKKAIADECADHTCDAQTYYRLFSQVAPACWLALLKEK